MNDQVGKYSSFWESGVKDCHLNNQKKFLLLLFSGSVLDKISSSQKRITQRSKVIQIQSDLTFLESMNSHKVIQDIYKMNKYYSEGGWESMFNQFMWRVKDYDLLSEHHRYFPVDVCLKRVVTPELHAVSIFISLV